MNWLLNFLSNKENILFFLATSFVFLFLGIVLKDILIKIKFIKEKKESQKIVKKAIDEATRIRNSFKEDILEFKNSKRILEKKEEILLSKEKKIEEQLEQIEKNKTFYEQKKKEFLKKISAFSGISKNDAKNIIIDKLKREHQEDLNIELKKLNILKKLK